MHRFHKQNQFSPIGLFFGKTFQIDAKIMYLILALKQNMYHLQFLLF